MALQPSLLVTLTTETKLCMAGGYSSPASSLDTQWIIACVLLYAQVYHLIYPSVRYRVKCAILH